jgi:hypothetical protein
VGALSRFSAGMSVFSPEAQKQIFPGLTTFAG